MFDASQIKRKSRDPGFLSFNTFIRRMLFGKFGRDSVSFFDDVSLSIGLTMLLEDSRIFFFFFDKEENGKDSNYELTKT